MILKLPHLRFHPGFSLGNWHYLPFAIFLLLLGYWEATIEDRFWSGEARGEVFWLSGWTCFMDDVFFIFAS
jgi:hypothetical protein